MSLNKIMLIGNLGKDPELKTFPDGGQLCNISIATKKTWKDKATGDRKESTQWHRVVFNGALAGIANQYLKKGSQVYVEGSLESRKWADKDGIEKETYEVKVTEMKLLDKRSSGDSDDGGGYGQGNGDGYAPKSRPAPAPRQGYVQRPTPPAPAPAREASGFDDMDDDIPF